MEQEKQAKRVRRNFTAELKEGAVRLVLEEGKSITGVAKALDRTVSALGRWVEQARADGGKSKRGTLTTGEKEELARLRRDVRVLRVERDILKKSGFPSSRRRAREIRVHQNGRRRQKRQLQRWPNSVER
jgi:transposase